MGKFFNRVWNTVWVIPRGLWTALTLWVDTAKAISNETLLNLSQIFNKKNKTEKVKKETAWNLLLWIWRTFKWTRETIKNSFQGKRYKKLYKVPATLIASPFMLIEWGIETLLWCWYNCVKNTKDLIWNGLINWWKTIKTMWSSEPYKNFKFERLDEPTITPKMYIANALYSNKDAAARKAKKDEKKKKLEEQKKKQEEENKKKLEEIKKENEKREQEREAARKKPEEEHKKRLAEMEEERKKRLEEIKKQNEKVEQEREAAKKKAEEEKKKELEAKKEKQSEKSSDKKEDSKPVEKKEQSTEWKKDGEGKQVEKKSEKKESTGEQSSEKKSEWKWDKITARIQELKAKLVDWSITDKEKEELALLK